MYNELIDVFFIPDYWLRDTSLCKIRFNSYYASATFLVSPGQSYQPLGISTLLIFLIQTVDRFVESRCMGCQIVFQTMNQDCLVFVASFVEVLLEMQHDEFL